MAEVPNALYVGTFATDATAKTYINSTQFYKDTGFKNAADVPWTAMFYLNSVMAFNKWETFFQILSQIHTKTWFVREHKPAILDNRFLCQNLPLERPLRAQTAQGERVALARSDTCPPGTSLEFNLWIIGKIKQPLLEVRGLSRKNHFADVSFSLYPGEILGITGLLGSGRTELALALLINIVCRLPTQCPP